MAGARRCANCGKPLRIIARADARFCGRACKAAARRRRRRDMEAIDIGLAVLLRQECELVATCPVCGKRFALGHGHRRDAVYDCPACRQAAYRARHRERGYADPVTGHQTGEVTDHRTRSFTGDPDERSAGRGARLPGAHRRDPRIAR